MENLPGILQVNWMPLPHHHWRGGGGHKVEYPDLGSTMKVAQGCFFIGYG